MVALTQSAGVDLLRGRGGARVILNENVRGDWKILPYYYYMYIDRCRVICHKELRGHTLSNSLSEQVHKVMH